MHCHCDCHCIPTHWNATFREYKSLKPLATEPLLLFDSFDFNWVYEIQTEMQRDKKTKRKIIWFRQLNHWTGIWMSKSISNCVRIPRHRTQMEWNRSKRMKNILLFSCCHKIGENIMIIQRCSKIWRQVSPIHLFALIFKSESPKTSRYIIQNKSPTRVSNVEYLVLGKCLWRCRSSSSFSAVYVTSTAN